MLLYKSEGTDAIYSMVMREKCPSARIPSAPQIIEFFNDFIAIFKPFQLLEGLNFYSYQTPFLPMLPYLCRPVGKPADKQFLKTIKQGNEQLRIDGDFYPGSKR